MKNPCRPKPVPASLCLLLLATLSAAATPLVIATGPNNVSTAFNPLANGYAVGFTLAHDYTNVSITATLAAFGSDGVIGFNGYLSTQLGPGTTLADVVASSSGGTNILGSPLSDPYTLTPIAFMSGLSLSAGSYFFSLQEQTPVPPGNQTAYWVVSFTSDYSLTTFDGATVGSPALAAGILDPFLFASPFVDLVPSGIGGLWFEVSGDRVVDPGEEIPEPQTIALTGLSLALLAFTRTLRHRRS